MEIKIILIPSSFLLKFKKKFNNLLCRNLNNFELVIFVINKTQKRVVKNETTSFF